MVRPTKLVWNVVKHVLWYLRGNNQLGIWYKWTKGVKLCGFTDVDWVGIPSDQKSTLEGIFIVGSAVVSWYNNK